MAEVINQVNALEPVRRLFTVAQFSHRHPAMSQAALRHLIFDADRNDFHKVIKRIGKRKILLDEDAFFEWVDEQQKKGGRMFCVRTEANELRADAKEDRKDLLQISRNLELTLSAIQAEMKDFHYRLLEIEKSRKT